MKKEVLKLIVAVCLVFIGMSMASAQNPIVKKVDVDKLPDRIRITFKINQPVKIIFYQIESPPQIIADIIGGAYTSNAYVSDQIPIDVGYVKSIEILKDESMGRRLVSEAGYLYGLDLFMIKLDKMVAYQASRQNNTYYLEVAKFEDMSLTEKQSDKKTLATEKTDVTKKQRSKPQEEPILQMDNMQLARHWRNVGHEHQKSDDYQKAIQYYKKAIDLDPIYACAYNDLGIAYYYLNKPYEAIKQFKKALEINPNYKGAYSNQALIYEELGNKEKALYYWKKRFQLSTKNSYWHKRSQRKIEELE
jgi:tetratricopeptide (TPR) repeat protein